MKQIRKKLIKSTALIVTTTFVLSNNLAYAQIFTDVPDSHWASEYVDDMNKAGIITGYSDATFRPDTNVTKTQAVVMVSRLLGLDSNTIGQAKTTYQSFLNEVGVEAWAQDAVAAALYKGIVTQDAVRTAFYKNGTPQVAEKAELTIYLTRAMGLESEAENMTYWYLPFKDKESIPTAVQPYVKVMVDKEVINSQGDSQGRFNPKANVNRAMMAKMLAIAYDYVNDNDVSGGSSITPPTTVTENTTDVSGTIYGLITDSVNKEVYLTIENSRGDKVAYRANTDTVITVDGEEGTQADLIKGLKVEAKVTDDYRIAEIDIESINEEYTGTVRSITLTNPAVVTIEYEEDDDTQRKSFSVSENVDITLDEEDADIEDLESGDSIEIEVVNNRIVEIVAESQYRTIEGIIAEVKYQPEPMLVIEDEDENTYEYPIDSRVSIERNNRRAQITDLKEGDEVELELEYSVITDIEATVVKSEETGTIKGINIAEKPEITIVNQDGEEKTYYVSKDVDIEIDRELGDLYGLRRGYYVDLEIEGKEIVTIDAEVRQKNDRYTGTISYINTKAGVIVVSIDNPVTGEEETVPVYVDDGTSFIDYDGRTVRLSSLYKGDEIMAIGSSDGVIFTAKSIIVIEEGN